VLVIDGGGEAEILGYPGALVISAGDTHDAAAVDFPDLPRNAAVAPAAAETTSVSPFLGAAISMPKKAVSPLVPSTPRKTVSETKGIFGNFWKKLFADASMTTYS